LGSESLGKIDLHIHSNASDGTFSPAEIVHQAQVLRLEAIAITDHDTIDGAKASLEMASRSSVKILTGIEISAESPPFYRCPGSFHILGYGIHLDDPSLNRTLAVLQEARKNRNPRIIERLQDMGLAITLQEVTASVGDAQIGRPHFARVMLQKGFVASIDEAFDRYIGTRGPAYVDKYRIPCEDAIRLIRGAGGIPVLAHPGLLKPETDVPFDRMIAMLKEMGIEGIEVYYPEHSASQTRSFGDIARRYDLILTGGTDFHGAIKPDIPMGGREGFRVPFIVYEQLIRRCRR
jgi:3',5'-nucleoside bisphosphate phosphatase